MKCMIIFLLVLGAGCLQAQQVIPLYDKEIPNSLPAPNEEWEEFGKDSILRIHAVSRPTLTIYLPPKHKRNGKAVIICPGGGYRILAFGHEGTDVAKAFVAQGITAFVLKYRIPDEKSMADKSIGPLQDAQRALQIVRENARRWNINSIGIMGFSAGGHLAATAATHFENAVIPNKKNINLRPDFMVLIYPVISFQDSLAHMGSRENLLGKNAAADKVNLYSNELQVTHKTPPAFLVHAKDDAGVKVANSTSFAAALKKAGVPVSVYLYEKGGHGFGMTNKTSQVRWMDQVVEWIGELKINN